MSDLKTLLESKEGSLAFPKVSDVVKGVVIAVGRNEVRCDLGGIAIGLIRGPELDKNLDLRIGDEVEATVIELDNEFGELELSLKGAGRKRAWDKIKELFTQGAVISAKILDANKGGLITRVENVPAFLPVSQLSPTHYPRVAGGEKSKILEKLKTLVGVSMDVKILDVSEGEEKVA
jgi:small subunit ribosomal protein S1